jgi:hypothetical protein
LREFERGFVERERAEFERRADYHKHKHVIEDAMMRRLLGDDAPEREVVISLAALKDSLPSRNIPVRDGVVNGPRLFMSPPA